MCKEFWFIALEYEYSTKLLFRTRSFLIMFEYGSTVLHLIENVFTLTPAVILTLTLTLKRNYAFGLAK